MFLALGCNASSAQPAVSSTAPAACAASEPAPAPTSSARPYDLDADLGGGTFLGALPEDKGVRMEGHGRILG